MKRYAVIYGQREDRVAAYLPANYRVIYHTLLIEPEGTSRNVVVIEGTDNAGWTLDGYIIPRMASGLIRATEIDLSHPLMREVPA